VALGFASLVFLDEIGHTFPDQIGKSFLFGDGNTLQAMMKIIGQRNLERFHDRTYSL